MSEKDDFDAELKKVADLLREHGYEKEGKTLSSALSLAATTSGLRSEAKLNMYSAGAAMFEEAHFNLNQILTSHTLQDKQSVVNDILEAMPIAFERILVSLGKGNKTQLQ